MAKLIQERRRRLESNPLDFYRALPHASAFHASKARVRALIGSNRCGKSEGNTVEVCRYGTDENPHKPKRGRTDGWVVSVTNEAQREILQPKFKRYIMPYLARPPIMRPHDVWDKLILKNGSTIGFKSCEMDVKTFQGVNLDYVSFDEEPEQKIYKECMARLLDRKGDAWISMTPLNGLDWSYDTFVDPDKRARDVELFGPISMWENAVSRGGYIPDEEITRFEQSLSDPIECRIRVYGEYQNQAGRIYKTFDTQVHVLQQLPRHFVNDDGTMSPHLDYFVIIDTGRCFAASFFLVDYLGNVVMFDEHYDEDKTISHHARRIHNMLSIYGISPTFVCDPSSQFFLELAENGINCQHGDNDVQKGIDTVQEYMHVSPPPRGVGLKYSNPRFYVLGAKCPRFMFEIQRYVWEQPASSGQAQGEKKNTPRKKDDHVMDTARYMLVQKPDPPKPPAGEEDRRPFSDQIRDHAKSKMNETGEKGGAEGTDPFGLDSF